MPGSDLPQSLAYLDLFLGLVGWTSSKVAQALASDLASPELGLALKPASAENIPSVCGLISLPIPCLRRDSDAHGASAMPKWRAIGMISRSKSRFSRFQRPW